MLLRRGQLYPRLVAQQTRFAFVAVPEPRGLDLTSAPGPPSRSGRYDFMGLPRPVTGSVMRAYVLITAKPGTSEEIIKYLHATSALKGVIHADSVYGRVDLVIVLEAPTMEAVSKVIYEVIEKIPNITHTETLISLFTQK